MSFELLKEYLSDEELKFLEEGKQTVGKNISSPEVMQKILIIAENFSVIVKHVKSGRSARIQFMEAFPPWSKKRRETIQKLKEIANAINRDRHNCNISRRASNITAIAGGGLVVASAILIPFTMGLSVSLGIAGGALVAAGGATNLGTSITEAVRYKANINEAQKIIKEDKELLEKFGSWMEHTDILSKAKSEIMEIDFLRDVISSVKKLEVEIIKIQNTHERKSYIETNIKKILKCSKETINITEIEIKTLLSLLIGIFVVLSVNDYRILFDCANLTVRALTGSVVLADKHVGLVCAGGTVGSSMFATTGSTLVVASSALAFIGTHNSSFSSQAQNILKIANTMEKEIKLYENVYNGMAEFEPHPRA